MIYLSQLNTKFFATCFAMQMVTLTEFDRKLKNGQDLIIDWLPEIESKKSQPHSSHVSGFFWQG